MNKITISIITILILTITGYVSGNDLEDAQTAHSEYCNNVDIFIDSNGIDGHPDYDGIYSKTCIESEVKS